MNSRRSFFKSLALLALAPLPPLKRLLTPRPKGLFVSEFKYAYKPSDYAGKWVFHQRD